MNISNKCQSTQHNAIAERADHFNIIMKLSVEIDWKCTYSLPIEHQMLFALKADCNVFECVLCENQIEFNSHARLFSERSRWIRMQNISLRQRRRRCGMCNGLYTIKSTDRHIMAFSLKNYDFTRETPRQTQIFGICYVMAL